MRSNDTQRHLVLYADDDPDDQEMLVDALCNYSNEVDIELFSNGLEITQFLRDMDLEKRLPCVIVLDINMPAMTGREVLHLIRSMERLNGVPVVLYTTSNQPADQLYAQQHKAGFITKPLDLSQMNEVVKKIAAYCRQSQLSEWSIDSMLVQPV